MTAQEKSRLMAAFQAKKALAGAGVILVEGPSTEVLRRPTLSKVYVVLYQLDQTKGHWSEPLIRHALALQLPSVGVQIHDPAFVCLIGTTHAAFLDTVTPTKLVAVGDSQAALAAAGALKEIGKELQSAAINLQEKMQRENLVFTSVSNVLKTRHDTVKNSISNVR